MVKPTLNDIKALIEQAEKLKQEVEQLKKKSFLTPVQSEAIKDRKRGIDIALHLLRLSYTNREECENNFGIVESYFTLTGSLNSGRFAQNLGGWHGDDYGEKPERIEWYNPNKHTGLFVRYDFDEKKFRRFLSQCTAKQRQLYWKKHIQPLIFKLDTDLTPWLPFMKLYIDTKGIQEAIKTAEPTTLSDAIYEFKKIQKVVETEKKQEPAEIGQNAKPDRDEKTTGNISGMTWEEAKKKAEALVDEKGYLGHKKLYEAIGCSDNTLRKAIKKSKKLQEAKKQYKSTSKILKAIGFTPKVVATYEGSSGSQLSDTETHEILTEMLEDIKRERPEMFEQTKKQLDEMNLDEKRRLAVAYQRDYQNKDKSLSKDGPKTQRQYKKV